MIVLTGWDSNFLITPLSFDNFDFNGRITEYSSKSLKISGGEMNGKAAYLIGHMTVKDEEKWVAYRSQVPDTLTDWGAEIVFRGKCNSVLYGHHEYSNTVIIRFPHMAALKGWYQSPDYQALIPLRNQGADMVLIGCE
jgi:uncharacterized protein (DUF1330 family)